MKGFAGLINRAKSTSLGHRNSIIVPENAPADSPEANVARAIRLFCESAPASAGAEDSSYLHLPAIVEAAESSPSAAASAALQIRKFLGKEFQARPSVQYNAIMLIRILSDNPGATFTRNFDRGFVGTVKELLRTGKNAETQQIVRETLDALEAEKAYDQGLAGLFAMWRKEKGQGAGLGGYTRGAPPASYRGGGPPQQQQRGAGYGSMTQYQQQQQPWREQNQRSSSHSRRQLPSPVELAGRVEEAKNTAKILLQLVQSTPEEEVLQNELIKEFSDRCQSAQRSMQGYINADQPPPDHDTMQTLIETNEQISLAMSRYQRALLAARRANGATHLNTNHAPEPEQETNLFATVADHSPNQRRSMPLPPPPTTRINGYDGHGSGRVSPYQTSARPPPTHHSPPQPQQQQASNPFLDPLEHDNHPGPLAIEPTNYGGPPQRHFASNRTSQAYNIDSEPAYPTNNAARNTLDLDHSSYAARRHPSISSAGGNEHTRTGSLTPISQPSPALSRVAPSESGFVVSPSTPQQQPYRPAPSAWHHSDITQSFLGRQHSAVNGLTMHGGASPPPGVSEIDGHSEVGRRDRDEPPSAVGSSVYDGSPVEVRTAQTAQVRRVDVPGTGGLRNVGEGAVYRH